MENYTATFAESVLSISSRTPTRVLITVPHDGSRNMHLEPYIPRRTRGVTRRDVGMWPISRDIAQLAPVNLVRGLVPRMHLDYNRPASEAYESPQMAASYAAYHGMIFQQLRQMQTVCGAEHLLVIDVHNFPHQPPCASRVDGYDIIIGTKHRATIRHGEPDRALAAHLEARGYTVYLSNGTPHQRAGRPDWYDGGFTVCTVAETLGVNALQIEVFAPKFCTRSAAIPGTRLSADIAEFVRQNYAV